jgi:hypothetical protein
VWRPEEWIGRRGCGVWPGGGNCDWPRKDITTRSTAGTMNIGGSCHVYNVAGNSVSGALESRGALLGLGLGDA